MKLTRDAFCDLRNEAQRALRRSKETPSVLICAGTGCIAGGAMKIYENLRAECESRNLPVYIGLKHDTDEEKSLHVKMSGCHGFCEMGPLVHIEPMGIMYIHVKPEDCHEILEKTVLGGEIIDRLVYRLNGVAYPRQEDIPFYKKQHRMVLENCGTSDAEDIEEYIAKGGYSALSKVLFEMNPESVCQTILESNLRGRGGGGFPTGLKWKLAKGNDADQKYVCCNADEGDPGAFKFAKPHIAGLDYSFSGLKTSFLYTLRDQLKLDPEFIEKRRADLAASLQKTIIDILLDKLDKAVKQTGVRTVAIGGGVSANSGVRNAVADYCARRGLTAFIPERAFTTDNAAMVAIAGYYKYLDKEFCSYSDVPYARVRI